MLREFYNAWVDFHKITNDGAHRKKKEAAAQRIVDARWALVRFDRMYGQPAVNGELNANA
jgi:hypothetical protein